MKLKDIKIGRRLFVGFGVVELLMVVLVITGIATTRNMNTRLEYIVNVTAEKVEAAYDLKDAVNTINLTSLGTFSTKDEAYKAKSAQVIDANRQKYQSTTERLDKLETADAGKNLIRTIKDEIVAGRTNNNNALALMKEGKAQEAAEYFVANVLPTATKILDDCDRLIEYEHKQDNVIVAEAASAYHVTVALTIGIGLLALALAIFLTASLAKSVLEPIRKTIAQAEFLADGKLSVEIAVDRKDEFGQQASAMRGLVEKWREIIGSVKQASDSIAASSNQLAGSAGQMSDGASQQAERAHQVATASEEMSQTVEDIARNATSIATTATKTAATARDGGQTVEQAVKEVTEIAETVGLSARHITSLADLSKRIGEIIGIINEIADQTNLLALNAAIEAARAGEHGRGFAVVADEVRKLAERTTGATSEVSGIIKEIQGKVSSAVTSIEQVSTKVERGVDLSTKAGEELQVIVKSVDELHLMIQQIATAIDEMSATSDQISKDIESISAISAETSQSSDEVHNASSELSRLGVTLQDVARQFEV
jgi:methyl-accepting chemotaxis protein